MFQNGSLPGSTLEALGNFSLIFSLLGAPGAKTHKHARIHSDAGHHWIFLTLRVAHTELSKSPVAVCFLTLVLSSREVSSENFCSGKM